MKKTFVGCALTLLSMLALHSCYKEDAQELYQRQYATSVAMADLQEQANHFNQKILTVWNSRSICSSIVNPSLRLSMP